MPGTELEPATKAAEEALISQRGPGAANEAGKAADLQKINRYQT